MLHRANARLGNDPDEMVCPTKPLKVMYMVVTLPVGGTEQILLNVSRNLDRSRFEPVICCLGQRGAMADEIASCGVRVIELGCNMRHFGWRAVQDLSNLMQSEGVDVLHTSLYHANFFGRIAARLARVPVVVTWVHNVYDRSNRKLQRRLANRLLARYTDCIVAVSHAVRQEILRWDGVRPDLVRVIHAGVPRSANDPSIDRQAIRSELGIPPEAFVIGTVGRLVEQKNHDRLLRVFRRVLAQCPRCWLIIVGGGPLEDRLKRHANELGVSGRTVFTGRRRDVANLLQAFDVFALSSDYEGLGIVLLEAMFMGLPTVATNVGGIPEVVEDGKTGILIPAQDEEAFASALAHLALDASEAAMLGSAALQTAEEKWTVERFVHDLQSLYGELYDANTYAIGI